MRRKQREERFYKTGDYVSVDPDGTVHFLGRVDRQVKVNGYRVELEHIESVLRRVEGVHDAAVFHLEVHGKHRLVAAILRRSGSDVSAEVLAARLEILLPEYMIPRTFLSVDEFPRNDNGKTNLKLLREVVLDRLAEKRDAEAVPSTPVVDQSTLAKEIRELWARHLRDRSFGDDDSFFTLGGDSLEAIQVIAELQLRGYDVTAHAFLSQPTVRGLMQAIAAAPGLTACAGDAPAPQQSRALTSAQAFFFRQQLAQPDHYNQALLLECASKVDVDALREAAHQVLSTHTALSVAYAHDEAGTLARLTSAPEDALSASILSPELDEAGVQKEIDQVSERVHRSISLSAGRLFRAHLFERPGARDQLLLVAHHVAVDVVSWRIILEDLVRVYCERLAGRSSTLFRSRTTLWGWVEHLEGSRDALLRESEPWLSKAREARERGKIAYDDWNTEGASRTAWFGFSSEETQRLVSKLSAMFGALLHQALLGIFAYWYARERELGQLIVDVESHGRVTLDGSVDVSRLVGWHTSTFPLDIEVGNGSLSQAIGSIADGLRDIPHLGAAFGLSGEQDGSSVASPSSGICYNYLGEINLGYDERFAVRRSPYAMVSARGEQNNRLYELKLTGRVIEGHFIVDLSFPTSADVARVASLMRRIQATLSELAGLSPGVADLIVEEGSRTGLLTHVPARLLSDAPRAVAKEYRAVFITGATGFVGVHVLRELFSASHAHVYCLVRAKDGFRPEERLRRAYDAYFPEAALASFAERYTVLEGDASQERFGLTEEAYAQLSSTVEAIYHFAGETKLFGQEDEFRRHNVMSVQRCVDLAGRTRLKDLHHMSTLAVSGVNPRQEPVNFSEDSMDVGQEFQNFYESTKYAAECVAKSAEASGCRVFIYRSGNVSGHSQTARFQTNARDNRFVQFLAACSKLAKLPCDLGSPIVLSPIDEVSTGIVAISLAPSISGGVFHVDSSFAVPLDRVFHAMRQHGLVLEDTQHPSFASLFAEAYDRQDPEVALGHFWASRKPRNVRYDNERTHQVLGRLGRSFTNLDDMWLSKFIRQLVSSGVLAATPALPAHGGDCFAAKDQAQ